jgi:hypothetical protein
MNTFNSYEYYGIEGRHLVKLRYWNELISQRKLTTEEQYQFNQDLALLLMDAVVLTDGTYK